jgi:hypothetical protein
MTNLWSGATENPARKTGGLWCPPRGERVLLIVFLVPLAISFGFRLLLLYNRWFDDDEYEHLHYAWMVMNGYLPYRDFFENHPPGLWYLLAPLAWLFDESPVYLFAGRMAMFLLTVTICFMVYKLASTGPTRAAPLFAILLLNVELTFATKTLEVRPDHVVILAWLLGAWLLIGSPEAIPHRTYGASGLSVGIGLLFSPKALFAIAALGGALLLLRPIGRLRAPAWRDIALFALMSLTPIACMLLIMGFWDEGWPSLLLQQVFLYNFAYPERSSGFYALYRSLVGTPVFWGSAGLGCLLTVVKFRGAHSVEPETRRLVILAVSTGGAAAAHFVFIPAPYPQTLLPLVVFLAILGGECGRWISDRFATDGGSGRRKGMAVCLVTVLLMGSSHALGFIASKEHLLTRSNHAYLEWLASILSVTARSDSILDGYAKYIFRPQASFYGWLGKGLLKAIRSGTIQYDIPERCAVNGCPVVILDARLRELGPWIEEYAMANYAPSSVKDVYIRRDAR